MKMNQFLIVSFFAIVEIFAVPNAETGRVASVVHLPASASAGIVGGRIDSFNAIAANSKLAQQAQSRAAAKNTPRHRSASLSHTVELKQTVPTRSHSTLVIPDVFKKTDHKKVKLLLDSNDEGASKKHLDSFVKDLKELSKAENQSIAVRNRMIPEIVKKYDDYRANLPKDYVIPSSLKSQSDLIDLEMKLRKLEITRSENLETKKKLLDGLESQFVDFSRQLNGKVEQEGLIDIHRDLMAAKLLYKKERYDADIRANSKNVQHLKYSNELTASTKPQQADDVIIYLVEGKPKADIDNYSIICAEDFNHGNKVVSELKNYSNKIKNDKNVTHVADGDSYTILTKKELLQKIDDFVTSVEQNPLYKKQIVENYQTQHSTPAKTSLTQKIKNFFTRTKNPAERKAFFTSIVDTDPSVKSIGSKNTSKSVTVDKDADAIVSKVMSLPDNNAKNKFILSLTHPGRFDRNTKVFNKGNVQDKLDAVISSLKKDEKTTHIADENSLVITSKEDFIKNLELFKDDLIEYRYTQADRAKKLADHRASLKK
jgi:hypothetical protein